MGETGFCDTADLRKLGEAGIGVGKTEVAGFANLGGERGAALFGKKLLHEVGLADGGVDGFLEIRRLAVHLPVHAVPHILHDTDALEVHVALGSTHDLEKFGDFIAYLYRTFRKKEGSITLAAQNILFLKNMPSSIKDSIIINCATKIILAHSEHRQNLPEVKAVLSITDEENLVEAK